MKSINFESPKKPENAEVALDKLENANLLSVNEERCVNIISNASKENLVKVCENLNNTFEKLLKENLAEVCKAGNKICAKWFSSKWIDFYAILDTINDPVWYKTS